MSNPSNSTENPNPEELLRGISDETAISMIPVMIYLFLLMIMGLLGNLMVCFYYGYKTRRTTTSIFICAVAVYDLLSCCLSVPIEIVDLRFFYVFTDKAACKFLRFINHFVGYGSVFTLLVIAVDRYRRICQPFKKQFTIRGAKIACSTLMFASGLFSWPSLILYSSVSVELKNKGGIGITGSDCTTIRNDSYKLIIWFYNGVQMFVFVGSVSVLSIMYSLVGRNLLKHQHNRQKFSHTKQTSECSNFNYCAGTVASEIMTVSGNEQMEKRNQVGNDVKTDTGKTIDAEASPKCVALNLVSMNTNVSIVDIKRVQKQQNTNYDINTIKYTVIMLVITILFIISFLPYLSLVVWRAVVGGHEDDVLSDAGLVAFQFGLRSYFLNAVCNPLTYGFFNTEFRKYLFNVVCLCKKRSNNTTAFTCSTGSTSN